MKSSFRKVVFALVASVLAASVPLTTFGFAPVGAAANAFVRVNQVGYETNAPKRAYLMASAPASGATFSVKNSHGVTVFSAPVGERLGSWSSSFADVYALDFSVTTPGTYSIVVSEPAAATSPSFRIDSAKRLYSFMLPNAVFFYQAQRDGPDVIRSVMNRRPSHLNDRSATVYKIPVYDEEDVLVGDLAPVKGAAPRDVSGGWFDAGDYIKGVQTASYAEALLLMAVRDHPDLLGPWTPANLYAETKFEMDWLQKMWDDDTQTLYYQVGIGSGNESIVGDHDLWRLPEEDDAFVGDGRVATRYIRNRPVFRAGKPGSLISPNLAGRMTAALALCYQVYKAKYPAYANKCLLSAQYIFDLADTDPQGDLLTYSPYDYYPENEWRDDLELGATELYFAVAGGDLPHGLPHTNPMFYLRKAARWAHAYITGPNDAEDTLNLYDVSSLAHYELHRAIKDAGNPQGLDVTKAALLKDIKKQLDNGIAQAKTDPFGAGRTYADFDFTSHSQGLAIMASLYDELSGTHTYAEFGRRQLGVILGSNPWGTSLIVGAGSTFPVCMQHQVANLVGSLDGTRPLVKGAAVNGPNGAENFEDLGLMSEMRACPPDGSDPFAPFNNEIAVYLDSVISWPSVEPAIDFVATTPLAFARLIAGLY